MQKVFVPLIVACGLTLPLAAQAPPPNFAPEQLDQLVSRVSLYQDPLLAQILTAATFANQIPDAADYAGHHRYLNGDQLAAAIQQDNLPWDPSVVALIPFPGVLDMMASDIGWTQQLGDAVLADRAGVMDAVQRLRRRAYDYGYLQNNRDIQVTADPSYIAINPVDPGYYYVPTYDPSIVFARPRPGFFVGGAISFGPRVWIGTSFAPWGWSHPAFGWREHSIIIDRHPWERRWDNRGAYVHPYAEPYRRPEYRPGYHVEERHGPAREEHMRGEEHHMSREGERRR